MIGMRATGPTSGNSNSALRRGGDGRGAAADAASSDRSAMLAAMRRRPLGRRVWRHVMSPGSLLALAGVASVAVIGVVLFVHLRSVGVHEAENEAEQQARLAAHGVVEPVITQELLDGDQAALDGRVVYADDKRLIGERFELDEEDKAVLANGGVDSGLSDLSAPENRFEPRGHDLLEVYVPIRGPGGQPLLY